VQFKFSLHEFFKCKWESFAFIERWNILGVIFMAMAKIRKLITIIDDDRKPIAEKLMQEMTFMDATLTRESGKTAL
jgi:hypothetical protein